LFCQNHGKLKHGYPNNENAVRSSENENLKSGLCIEQTGRGYVDLFSPYPNFFVSAITLSFLRLIHFIGKFLQSELKYNFMLYPALKIISDKLNSSIYEKWGETINGTSEIVQLNNIANINDEKNDLQNKIIFTVIKVEEETSLKNRNSYTKKEKAQIIKHHPPLYLNLYLLVSVTKKTYKEALQLLSDTITFFQAHNIFLIQPGDENSADGEHYRITVEYHEINLQEVFDMWSNLGNKHFPSVFYKIRLLKIFDAGEFENIKPIEKIKVQYENKYH
jgi:hypothetical protein